MSLPEPLTISDAAPLIRSGALTPSDLLEQCLARVDVYEPAVRAWVYLDRERARRDAARLTDELKAGHHRGPLHGIPVGIKDIIDVFDMPTGCGSKLWANSYARRDATCVERLRQAGAIVLGKTVTTPYAFTDPPITRNPWNLDRTPGGSSSGSAAAVACGMCLAALGTQTGGSLTRPASYCGVCSLKPSYGRVSVDGVLPLAPSLDHVGVIARCVRDLAEVFHAIGGADFGTSTSPIPDCIHAIETRALHQNYAVLRGVFDQLSSHEVRQAIGEFRKHAEKVEFPLSFDDVLPPPSFQQVHHWHRTIMSVETAGIHAERRNRVPEDYPARISELIADGQSRSAVEYEEASVQQRNLFHELEWTHQRNLTWLTPATTRSADSAETTGDPAMNSPWSFTRLPTISIPITTVRDGMPLAIQLVAHERAEARLFAAAANCEAVVGIQTRLPPIPPR